MASKQTKITNRLDRTKTAIQANSRTNSEQASIPTNPFRKLVNRHYGSFKARILGNHLKTFNTLPNSFKEKGKLGTTRRKFFSNQSFTLIVYSNGTIEIKPCRKPSNSLNAGEELSKSFWETASQAQAFLEAKNILLSPLEMNRRPKYAVKDKTAELVRKEVHSNYRDMDKSILPGHVDNWGKQALNRDNRLSSSQHLKLAKERLKNPEIIQSIEQNILRLNEQISEKLAFFARHLESHAKSIIKLGDMASLNIKVLKETRPKRHRFPSSFKKSATVKAVR